MMFAYLPIHLPTVSQIAKYVYVFKQQFGYCLIMNMAWHASHSQSCHDYYVATVQYPHTIK